MMKKTPILKALLLGSLMSPFILLASGCDSFGLGCTQAGCYDQASISIHGFEANQSYEVAIETADDTILCTIESTGELLMACDDTLFHSIDRDRALIALEGKPDSIAITVRQNGTVIAEDVVRPDYDDVAPNGRACGPVCKSAKISFEL